MWLDNLRYAFSACVYGYPAGVDSVSSQCLVSCQGLDSAIEFDLLTPNDINLRAWCSTSTFADNQIETCEFCYNLTETQVLMANCESPSLFCASLANRKVNSHRSPPL